MSRLTRCLLYSHHIHARAKIKAIHRLADDFNVDGVFKVGRPGYIFFHGDELNVQKAVKALKVNIIQL